jgi:putative transposase
MTVMPSIDPARLIEEQLSQASPDLLRELLTLFINTLMSAEADAVCGAAYGTTSPDRTNRRNGYRGREFDTRAGTLELALPKLRTGTYFPEWLLERRKRAERALTSVIATCYLLGVSTRRMDKLVQSLGITGLSKSQVSEMAKDLDEHVESFRSRRLDDAGPFTFVAADALVLKVREGGRVVGVHALVATGVNADGHREILGLQVTTSEDGAGWLGFFRDLVARGLTGVKLVTSDAHAGLLEPPRGFEPRTYALRAVRRPPKVTLVLVHTPAYPAMVGHTSSMFRVISGAFDRECASSADSGR